MLGVKATVMCGDIQGFLENAFALAMINDSDGAVYAGLVPSPMRAAVDSLLVFKVAPKKDPSSFSFFEDDDEEVFTWGDVVRIGGILDFSVAFVPV